MTCKVLKKRFMETMYSMALALLRVCYSVPVLPFYSGLQLLHVHGRQAFVIQPFPGLCPFLAYCYHKNTSR